jgi:hypothetical protein
LEQEHVRKLISGYEAGSPSEMSVQNLQVSALILAYTYAALSRPPGAPTKSLRDATLTLLSIASGVRRLQSPEHLTREAARLACEHLAHVVRPVFFRPGKGRPQKRFGPGIISDVRYPPPRLVAEVAQKYCLEISFAKQAVFKALEEIGCAEDAWKHLEVYLKEFSKYKGRV